MMPADDDPMHNRRHNGTDRWLRRTILVGVVFAVLTFAAIVTVLVVVVAQGG